MSKFFIPCDAAVSHNKENEVLQVIRKAASCAIQQHIQTILNTSSEKKTVLINELSRNVKITDEYILSNDQLTCSNATISILHAN